MWNQRTFIWFKILPNQENMHDDLVKLVVVPTKAEVTVSFVWAVNSVKGFDESLVMVEVHTGPNFPSLDFTEE